MSDEQQGLLREARAFIAALLSSPVLGPDDDIPVPRKYLAALALAQVPAQPTDRQGLDIGEVAEATQRFRDRFDV